MRVGSRRGSAVGICLLAVALGLGMVPGLASAGGDGSTPEGTELGYWPLDVDQDDRPVPGLSRDASAHDHHLLKKGKTEKRARSDLPFDGGYLLDQTLASPTSELAATHLLSPWSEAIGSQDLSLFLAFQRARTGDGDVLVQIQEPSYNGVGDTSLNLKILPAGKDNRLHYRHEDDAGARVNLEGDAAIGDGYHALTLQRTWDPAAGQGTVSIRVDGEEHIHYTFDLEPAHEGPRRVSLGAFHTGVQPLDGTLFEARLWDRAVDRATLEAIAVTGQP